MNETDDAKDYIEAEAEKYSEAESFA